MFERITPEQAGISSETILGYIKILEESNLNTHSLILARGNNIISETHYAPFDRNFKHRMYSVSKSFVGIAIGLLIDDGKISLDDKFISYFPEYLTDENCDEELSEMTIRDTLTMSTCQTVLKNWFYSGTNDRLELYFNKKHKYLSQTIWEYDSPGSYMLGSIVERITGKPFLDFMKERFLSDIGFSDDAYCIKCPGGHSFSDSGVMCTTYDLLLFARFVMNNGAWNGKQYMSADYVKDATSYIVANNHYGAVSYSTLGYGYHIWQSYDGGFSFLGMGDQLAICDRARDFIMVINSDNQGNPHSRFLIVHELYNKIIRKLSDKPLPENKEAYDKLCEYEKTRVLNFAKPVFESSFDKEISGKTYILGENPMGIEKFRIDFEDCGGTFYYTNAQGDKKLRFGYNKNEFQKFPQEGYSDMTAGKPCPGNTYQCAVSANWLEAKKFHIKVQAIDKYFGILDMVFSFKDTRVTVKMEKTAEAFFDEYQGIAIGKTEQ